MSRGMIEKKLIKIDAALRKSALTLIYSQPLTDPSVFTDVGQTPEALMVELGKLTVRIDQAVETGSEANSYDIYRQKLK